MATRTAKGTASSKTSGATLASSAVSFTNRSMIVVALGYDDAQGHPTQVQWGNTLLRRKNNRDPAGYDIAASVWVLPVVKDGTKSAAITATWSSAIVERAMVITEVDGKNRVDKRAGNNDAIATQAPVTVATAALQLADDFVLSFFVSEGPANNDTAGTAEIRDGGTFTSATLGQRAGTNGAPPASNVTVTEAYLQLSSASATEGRLQNATSRLWVSMIVALMPGNQDIQAVSPSDYNDIGDLFEAETPPLNSADAAVVWDDEEGRHEVYDRNDMATRIGFFDGNGWTAG